MPAPGLVTEAGSSHQKRSVGPEARYPIPAAAAGAPEATPTESEMETLLLQALRTHGLPAPIPQHEVWQGSLCLGRVDAAYPDEKIAIEYDSDEFHTGRAATKHDRARRHELIAASWLPIDVGPTDLRNGGTLTRAAIAQALRDRKP
jgi:hypothetical protein